jgi:ABC-2 type transport system permease protein
MSWWRGTWLVAQRSLSETVRSRTYRLVTALLLVASAAAVVVPQLVLGEPTTYTLATVGEAPAQLRAALESAASRGDFSVELTARPDETAVREAVRDDEATAGLAGDTLYTGPHLDPTFPVLVSQTVVALESGARLEALGLTPEQVAQVAAVEPPEQVTVGRVDSETRAAVGFGAGIALYVALTFAGSAIATAVALEKATRLSEVLLAVLRPSQVLVGTVAAIGTATLAQLLVLGAPLAVAIRLGEVDLPSVASGDLALGVVWFILGFALYAFLFAASAAMVDKVTEANAAVAPVTTLLVVGYLLSVVVVMGDPSSAWGTAVSMFPLSAPMAMPIRWSGGEVPVWQLLTSMALTAGTAVALVYAGSAVYRRALVVTGHRVRWRELAGRSRPGADRASPAGTSRG